MNMAAILLIDDNVSLLSAMHDVLVDADHFVSVSKDGKQALSLLASARFDLIITDIHMPNMDGLELLVELRTKVRGQKVIVMSGGGQALKSEDGLRVAKLMGAVKVLKKPFKIAELMEMVEVVLGGRRGR